MLMLSINMLSVFIQSVIVTINIHDTQCWVLSMLSVIIKPIKMLMFSIDVLSVFLQSAIMTLSIHNIHCWVMSMQSVRIKPIDVDAYCQHAERLYTVSLWQSAYTTLNAECHLCWVSELWILMLCVNIQTVFIQSVVMLNVSAPLFLLFIAANVSQTKERKRETLPWPKMKGAQMDQIFIEL